METVWEKAFVVLYGVGAPKGIRTPVFAVKGRRPRPLDDGRVGRAGDGATPSCIEGRGGQDKCFSQMTRAASGWALTLFLSSLFSFRGGVSGGGLVFVLPLAARWRGWLRFLERGFVAGL